MTVPPLDDLPRAPLLGSGRLLRDLLAVVLVLGGYAALCLTLWQVDPLAMYALVSVTLIAVGLLLAADR